MKLRVIHPIVIPVGTIYEGPAQVLIDTILALAAPAGLITHVGWLSDLVEQVSDRPVGPPTA